jgi:spore maturation protein CgeB
MACLNSTSLAEGNSLNCRAFEVAGAGGLQLIEAKPIISECFEPGVELLVFDTLDELEGHLDRARKAPVEMERIREAGARRALAHHTYAHRLGAILEALR